ncbi:Translation initiation factor eif-2b subunit delta [Thalictrum thalictroides]|uniref:Translation initiation factor eIF2B subunit delta n=1 Tax=Thalictrum thalictroides TaxID=46969 RepID=A0A7J6X6W6_THATH|nr:Translation initiation factor eif-2b subunit delta [Thalictrum thalictroides]
MDSRRASRMVIDPKVRQVGFVTPSTGTPPHRTQSGPARSASPSESSPAGNSLPPVTIPPRRHASDNLTSQAVPVPVPMSPLRRLSINENIPVGSYESSEYFLGASPMTTPSIKFDDGEVSEDMFSPGKFSRVNSGGLLEKVSSFPTGGFDSSGMQSKNYPGASSLTTISAMKKSAGVSEKAGGVVELQNEQTTKSKSLKEKTSKAERRALQEAQRAAKAAAKGEGSNPIGSGGPARSNAKTTKTVNNPPQRKDAAPSVISEKRGSDRQTEKDRKKDVPPPRMQFDDKERVEKAKRRAVVKQTEARNRVELFRHLPQYEHGTQLPNLESKFFQLDPMHPAVYKVGLRYLTGDICGGNARCIAMLQAFKESIMDYSTPPEKAFGRDLTAKIGSYVSFMIECRPLSISMGNAIRFLKNRISKLPLTLPESEAKAALQTDIDRFINEKIILADKVIVEHAVTKIRDGDVLLTHGSSSVVEMILLYAHELGKQFRVVIVDSRPKLEGQALLRRLLAKGLSCTYTHINAISYIMHEVTHVFLGASAVLSNGTVYSRVGTACVCMVAYAFRIPVLICCEAYKFHERVQLDSICSNELGDPDIISKVPGREDVNHLDEWSSNENLQLLNLIYDVTPSDYVSMIITDYGMVPPTSVPVIVREYMKEPLWM